MRDIWLGVFSARLSFQKAMASGGAETPKPYCFINILPDAILAKIFAHLPHKERLRLSEVCSRWNNVTRLDWLDVIDLDLTPIPSPNIGAILRLSPKVESIFALRRFLILNDLTDHYQMNLTSVKLYDVKMGLASITGDEDLIWFMEECTYRDAVDLVDADKSAAAIDSFHQFPTALNRYFEKMPQLDELVLHNLSVSDLSQLPALSILPFEIQRNQLSSLTRLQLSGSGTRRFFHAPLLIESLRNLQILECLILHGCPVFEVDSLPRQGIDDFIQEFVDRSDREFCDAVASLKSLRELSLAIRMHHIIGFDVPNQESVFIRSPAFAADIAFQLPKLEILFLIDQWCDAETFAKIFTMHPTLRVLMFTGLGPSGYDTVPTRKLQATATSNPLPFLNVFLGHGGYRLRFAESPAAAIFKFHVPIQEFLERADIAEILNGVWVAEMITETTSYDPQF